MTPLLFVSMSSPGVSLCYAFSTQSKQNNRHNDMVYCIKGNARHTVTQATCYRLKWHLGNFSFFIRHPSAVSSPFWLLPNMQGDIYKNMSEIQKPDSFVIENLFMWLQPWTRSVSLSFTTRVDRWEHWVWSGTWQQWLRWPRHIISPPLLPLAHLLSCSPRASVLVRFHQQPHQQHGD